VHTNIEASLTSVPRCRRAKLGLKKKAYKKSYRPNDEEQASKEDGPRQIITLVQRD
jgi:hypothetical protein